MDKVTLGCVTDANHLFLESSPFYRLSNYKEAVPWLRQLVADLFPEKPGFYPKPIRTGFIGDGVALGQDFLKIL